MTIDPQFPLLAAAGFVAGLLNAIGGGGTFVALPALVAAGLPPVAANASSTVALLPGALASAWAYRGRVTWTGPTSRTALTAASATGGVLGAGLLLALPATSFDVAVPWLLAFATVVLAFGRAAGRLLSRVAGEPIAPRARTVLIGQVLLGAYGGYFGGAVGILMLAFWGVLLGLDPATGNGMRVTQLAVMYTVAAAFFLVFADVRHHPLPVVAMLCGAVLGGFAGGRVARRMSGTVLRGVVLVTAVTTTVLYFVRLYG